MSKHRRNTNTKTKDVPFTVEARAAAWSTLTELADELQVLDDYLAPSREGPAISQMSAETNAKISQLISRERAERFGHGRAKAGPRDPWGLDIIYPIGASQAPARVASLDAAAAAHGGLIALERQIVGYYRFCPVRAVEDIPAAARALRVRSWLHLITSAQHLTEVERRAASILNDVEHAIDGDPSTKLDAPCPFCGRRTLVAYPRRGIIRCDRTTGQECRCQTEGCKCEQGMRHVWKRDHGQWNLLARLLEEGRTPA